MTKHLKAIYEDGVFRPLEPVSLKERQEITLSIDYDTDDNLADLAEELFGDQGTELKAHPPVTARVAPDFGA